MVWWRSQREYVRGDVWWVVCRVRSEISFAGRAVGAVGSNAVYSVAVATVERCIGAFPRLRFPLHGHYNTPKRPPGKRQVYAAPSNIDGSTTRPEN